MAGKQRCTWNPMSSRVCERGHKGCDVMHGEADPPPAEASLPVEIERDILFAVNTPASAEAYMRKLARDLATLREQRDRSAEEMADALARPMVREIERLHEQVATLRAERDQIETLASEAQEWIDAEIDRCCGNRALAMRHWLGVGYDWLAKVAALARLSPPTPEGQP